MKSAIVIGASRGIGRQIALTLSQHNYGVIVAAKTMEPDPKLPGTVSSVAEEIRMQGGVAYPVKCDCRHEVDIQSVVRTAIDRFGHVDVTVYNAGAVLWRPVVETPVKRFDLMMSVNVRGAYIMIQELLPHLLQRQAGRILLVAPPIYNRFFKGKTAYSVSKVGMTVLANGLSHELQNTGVSVSTLWPATVIRSHVTDVLQVPETSMRLPTIFADAVLGIANEPTDKLNGANLLDEDYLRSEGLVDFSPYRCVPDVEPPRMMPRTLPDLSVEEDSQTSNTDSSNTNNTSNMDTNTSSKL